MGETDAFISSSSSDGNDGSKRLLLSDSADSDSSEDINIQCITNKTMITSESAQSYGVMNECGIVSASTSSSSSDSSSSGPAHGGGDTFLVEACIEYNISGEITDCIDVEGLFLPLCDNTDTTGLTAESITALIGSDTFSSD